MTDPAATFRAELAVLRDRVVRALREDNVTDLTDGLELYGSLVTTVLDQFRKYEAISGPPGLGLLSFYGREMSWLEDDIRTFLRKASMEPGSDATHEVLAFLLGITIEAFNRKELPAFGSFLEKYRFAWYAAKHEGPPEGWTRLRSNMLLTLENFADGWIGRELRQSGDAAAIANPFARRFIAELAQLMKFSVDDGSAEDLAAAGRTLNEAMRFAIDRLGETDDFDAELASSDSLSNLKAAVLIAIEAWVLFRLGAEKTGDSLAQELLTTLRRLPSPPRWGGYVEARRQATSDLLGWSWWETSLWEDRRSGFLAFEGSIERTFAAELIDGRADVPSAVGSLPSGFRYDIDRLLTLIDELAAEPDVQLPLLQLPDPARVQQIRERLTSLKMQLEAAEDQRLIALELEPAEIDAFRRAVVEAWSGPRHLRSLVHSTPRERGGASPGDDGVVEPEPIGFGSNTLVPKDYFVTLTNVHADPADLGREFGDGLGRGEGSLLLAQLETALPSIETSLDGFPSEVERSVEELVSRGMTPTVLILNSWELLEALRHLEIEPEGAWATADLDEAPRLRRSGAPLLLRYTEGNELCIVADFRTAVAIRHRGAEPELPGDQIHAGGQLLTGVLRIDEERATEMVAANSRFKESDGSEISEDAAVRNLMKQVHVRVLEWITVDVADPDAGRIIHVEGLT